ncbi:hypothetical protein LCGC14_1436810 [marine sediment metagenome]|uniref:Uncharacterized protein n=1 Tax=marine sediment metagenome TaxID=412755 RepID=A0A0F9JM03_9ZZZZ
MIRIPPQEMANNSGGISIANAFGVGGNHDAAVLDWGAVQHSAYIVAWLPPAWQGNNIDILMGAFHKKSGLTTGVDDEVSLELGYETLVDLAIAINPGTINDGTAPHEVSQSFALGVTQEAVTWISLTAGANIAVGASDNWIQFRITRDALNGAPDDTLAASLYSMGLVIIKV